MRRTFLAVIVFLAMAMAMTMPHPAFAQDKQSQPQIQTEPTKDITVIFTIKNINNITYGNLLMKYALPFIIEVPIAKAEVLTRDSDQTDEDWKSIYSFGQ